MAAGDRRDLQVLVLGRPGETSRRFRIRRGAIVGLVLGVLGAGLAVGYVLGGRAAKSRVVADAGASVQPSAAPAHVEPPVMPRRQSPPIAPAAATAAGGADAGAATVIAAAPQLAAPEAAPAGEALRFLRDGQGEEIEVHPFAADGSPNPSAFQRLEAEMACGSGHSAPPDPALVRVLLAAQQEFRRPLVLLGGRCAAHEDHAETVAHHRAGRAADIRLRGVPSEQLMSWLIERGVGGAGRYKRASYLHVDMRTGPREQWEAVEERPKPKPAAQTAVPAGEEAAPAPGNDPAAAEPAATAPAQEPPAAPAPN